MRWQKIELTMGLQGKAAEEKEKGNKAFADKRYDDAVNHFTVCIELDPECVSGGLPTYCLVGAASQ